MVRNVPFTASLVAVLAGLAMLPLFLLKAADPAATPTKPPAEGGDKPPANPIPSSPLTTIILDPTGTGTFVYAGQSGATFTLRFHAGDYPDAIRTITGFGGPLVSSPDPIFSLMQGVRVASLHTQPFSEVLDELRGQAVQATLPPDATTGKSPPAITGTIVSVDAAGDPTKGATYTLNISSNTGVVPVALAGTTVILTDDHASKELQFALSELARGTALWDRTITVQGDGKGDIRYSHPVAPWTIHYRMDLSTDASGKTSGTLSASATVRNTTAQDWKKADGTAVDLRLSGLAWNGASQPFKVVLNRNQYATFALSDTSISATTTSWSYQLGQATTGQSAVAAAEKVVVTLPTEKLPPPAPVVVVEDKAQVGSPTPNLNFDASGTAPISFPNALLTVRADAPVEKLQFTLVQGVLTSTTVHTVNLHIANSSTSEKTLQLLPEKSFNVAPPVQTPADTTVTAVNPPGGTSKLYAVAIPKNVTRVVTVTEVGAPIQQSLLTLSSSQLTALINDPSVSSDDKKRLQAILDWWNYAATDQSAAPSPGAYNDPAP